MAETQGFGSLQIAAQLRDAIIKIAQKEIETLRPEMKVAVVKEINASQLTAKVQLSGDEGTFNVRFGASLMPRAVGDMVRINGKVGNYYITEILNNSGAHSVYEPIVDQITDEDGNVDVTPGIPEGSITQILLGDQAVGTEQIEELAVSEEKIADGAVTINKLSVVMGGGQMMDNSSFENVEDFLDGWTVGGTDPTRETVIVHGIGLAAARFTDTSTAYREVEGLDEGVVYTVTAYAWRSAGSTILPTMRVSDGTGANSQDQMITAMGAWVRSVARYTANATGKVRVALLGSQGGVGTGYVVWDDVQVERGDVPTAWNAKVTELLPGTVSTAMLQTGAIIVGGSDRVVFAPGYDPSTKASQSDLTNIAEVGRLQDNYLQNSTFDDWPEENSAPTGYMLNAGIPVREVSILRTSPTALRFNVGAGVANYIQPTQYPIGNAPFVTVRADVRLLSGAWGGSGILVRWYNTLGAQFDAVVDFGTILSTAGVGVWWRAETVVQRPTGFTGTFDRVEVWPIGGWTGIGTIAAKEIVFDQLSARQSTSDEVKAWTAGLWAYPGTTEINGGMLRTGTVIADQVTASAINALVEIVGPAFRTASNGQRIVMRNDGSGGVIEGFNGAGDETLPATIDPGLWSSTYPALILTSGKRTGYTSQAVMALFSMPTASTRGQVVFNAAVEFYGSIYQSGSTSGTNQFNSPVLMQAGGTVVGTLSGGTFNGTHTGSWSGSFDLSAAMSASRIVLNGTGGSGSVDATGRITTSFSGTADGNEAIVATGRIRGDSFRMSAGQTSGNAANTYTDTGGVMYRSTSSRRYKYDIEHIELDPTLTLKLRATTHRRYDDSEYDESNPELGKLYLSYIAEEVAEVSPWMVTYDENNKPDALNLQSIVMSLVETVKWMSSRIEILESR